MRAGAANMGWGQDGGRGPSTKKGSVVAGGSDKEMLQCLESQNVDQCQKPVRATTTAPSLFRGRVPCLLTTFPAHGRLPGGRDSNGEETVQRVGTAVVELFYVKALPRL